MVLPYSTKCLHPFFPYVGNTWMTNVVWAVENWSVYGRSVRTCSTNNDVKGWHNRLNRRRRRVTCPSITDHPALRRSYRSA
ncbi:hypothetical protein DPMN_168964 [Dreissena polymorpha]|uniref:Uncharacterized protein n=1 Tax=Dreissena polymorpha TaxID=45954 RepID=A0A9D4F7K9_DREPO|nr:hypothetical protein DPMN_168964 [Dreissena polymorpha]